MAKRKFAQRTIGIIEQRHSRGISAVSIAGELGTSVERVEAEIRKLESKEPSGSRHQASTGRQNDNPVG